MSSFKRYLVANKYYYAVLAVAALVMLVLNSLTTLKGDDYVYALLPDDLQHRCTSLADYVRSMPAFYQDTNGRLADALERFFASLVGRPLFNVLNTMVFVLLIEGILTLSLGRRRSLLMLAVVLSLIAVAFPYPGETLLWMAGSFNYLWSVTATLWLLCWLKYMRHPAPWWQHLLIFVYALVTGGFNESTSLACIFGLCLYYLLNRQEFVGLRRTALIGQILGVAVILASPALWNRLEGGGSVNMNLALSQMLSRRVLAIGYMSLRFVTPAVALAVVFHTWHRLGGWKAVRRRADYCLYVAAVLAAMAFGLLVERSYTFLVCVSMVVVARAFWPASQRLSPRWSKALTALLLAGCAVGSAVVINQVSRYRDYDQQVVSQMANGPSQCILRASQSPVSSRWVLPDVYDNDAFYCAYRAYYCYYFGKDNIQFLSPEIYRRYQEGTLLEGAVAAPFTSSDSTRGTTLLAVPGQAYALMPIAPGSTPENGKGKVYRTDMEQYWGKSASQRRYLLGSLKDFVPIRPYWLVVDGQSYQVIAGELDDKVTKVELDYLVDGHWQPMYFTRNN